MRVKYVGDPRNAFEGPNEITQHGVTFKKDHWMSVPDDHPFAAKFRHNETFEVKGEKDALDHDDNGRKGGSKAAPKAGEKAEGAAPAADAEAVTK